MIGTYEKYKQIPEFICLPIYWGPFFTSSFDRYVNPSYDLCKFEIK